MTYGSAWTDERKTQLRELLARGSSFSQAAAKMGLTRNAVIGGAHRLGLSAPVRKPYAGQEQKPALKPKQTTPQKSGPVLARKRLVNHGNRFNPPEQLPTLPVQYDGADVPIEQRRTLLQLNNHVCKWPFGSPGAADFFFCGSDVEAGKPYCKPHCNIAYVPPRR